MKSTSRRRILLAAGAAACAAAGAWVGWRRSAPSDTPDEATRVLFAQTMPTAQGQPFALSSLRGRTVVLNFWATWCPPCVDEMPELSALHQEISARNATVIGIGVDSADKIRQFSERGSFSYPLLVGGTAGEELSKLFGDDADALPYTVVIDPAGHIVFRKLGRIQSQKLRKAVFDTIGRAAG